jgi:hypothetical protein
MAFLGFLAGAALGGLAGYAFGARNRSGYWYPNYYAPYYYPMYQYQPYYYQQPYPAYQGYARAYAWHPWYGYW